jgi:replicative DNA helicase
MLDDPSAERGVLSGIFKYGTKAYYDVSDILEISSFSIDINQILYKCFSHILEADPDVQLDIPSILSAANELHLENIFKSKDTQKQLTNIVQFPTELKNVRRFAKKIRKLEIAKLLKERLKEANNDLSAINGDESLSEIIGIAENSVLEFAQTLDKSDNEPENIGDDLQDHLQYLIDNPKTKMGFSTGYSSFDDAIGGGLRRGTVSVIGARAKIGKSMLADNIALHLTKTVGIPVLNLDTEMRKEDHQYRCLGILTEVGITEIETGQFGKNVDKRQRVLAAQKEISKLQYHNKNVGGLSFEEQMSIARRWLVKTPGLRLDGTANDCVVIYDYIKLMTSDSLSKTIQEYQQLGFMMTGLHNFALKYNIPILAFIQLNRDGITKESTDVASGSDRIIWLCSNFSIFKEKSEEEIVQDKNKRQYNRKLVPIISRHGAGLKPGDYINVEFKKWCGKITDGPTSFELRSQENNYDDESGNKENISF